MRESQGASSPSFRSSTASEKREQNKLRCGLKYRDVDLLIQLLCLPLQSVIFYAVQSPKLDQWLRSDVLREQLTSVHDPQYVDIDRTFYHNIDEDYDLRHSGISKTSYLNCYLAWIQYCALRKDPVSKCL